MDYEYYYYESRNRYYNASSEITNCENKANELRTQQQQEISYINQLKADLRKHQNASSDLNTAIKKIRNCRSLSLMLLAMSIWLLKTSVVTVYFTDVAVQGGIRFPITAFIIP